MLEQQSQDIAVADKRPSAAQVSVLFPCRRTSAKSGVVTAVTPCA